VLVHHEGEKNMSRLVNKGKALWASLKQGQFRRIFEEFQRWIYSDTMSYGLRRDLNQPFETPAAKIPLVIRPLKEEDIRKIFDDPGYSLQSRLNFFDANIPTCYVATTSDDDPCYIQWLIAPSENERVQTYFKGLFPVLAPDEALLEYAYTLEKYRGQRIMPCAMSQFSEKAAEFGARWVITFVAQDNIPALKGCKNAGFWPYLVRKERWRLFRRQLIFTRLPEGTPYPFDA
jgi:hypothetical protein